MKTILSGAMLLVFTAGASAQLTATMPPHISTFSGNVRGYYFTAPVDFTMTGLNVLVPPSGTGAGNMFQNFAVLRFDGATPPPLFSSTTNAFTQLALEFDRPANAFFPVNLQIFAGDVIGIYGVTSDAPGSITNQNSYGNDPGGNYTDIFGNPVALFRSGMQFRLNSTSSPNGMQDVWSEGTTNFSSITRVEFTYVPAPGAAALLMMGGLCAIRRRR
jgi:hypothetical protein